MGDSPDIHGRLPGAIPASAKPRNISRAYGRATRLSRRAASVIVRPDLKHDPAIGELLDLRNPHGLAAGQLRPA